MLTYDITNDKLRTKIHRYLRNYGLNTQYSVFEMIVTDIELRKIVAYLSNVVPLDPGDNVRLYDICKSCSRNITKLGDGIDLHQLEYQII
jgi:CRISPR-associated protein Cas2